MHWRWLMNFELLIFFTLGLYHKHIVCTKKMLNVGITQLTNLGHCTYANDFATCIYIHVSSFANWTMFGWIKVLHVANIALMLRSICLLNVTCTHQVNLAWSQLVGILFQIWKCKMCVSQKLSGYKCLVVCWHKCAYN
jgi:hypothetical protein